MRMFACISRVWLGRSASSLPAQGEQRRSSYFNINRDNSLPRKTMMFS
jgi:hypothetical protein